jgi:2-polyprenyl-3-methyl-5-hydroxy-6-metoxy-1,4-benzoquinol methylase
MFVFEKTLKGRCGMKMRITGDGVRAIFNKYSRFHKVDDFNWWKYHMAYRRQITDITNEFTLLLSKDQYEITEGKIVLNPKLLPLNPNHKLLYETIYRLNPKSVLEVGVGGGDHIHNLHLLLPEAEFYGVDISQNQIDFLLHRHPDLKNICRLAVADVTRKDVLNAFGKADLVYTQAVLMHIRRGNRHIRALKNMFNISNYVVLMENWTSHNFFDDITKISHERDFPWPELNIYKNDSGEQILMILSRKELKEFNPLRNNQELLKYFQKKGDVVLRK